MTQTCAKMSVIEDMNPILVSLVQSAGVVALAVVSFALAFTWPSLLPSAQRVRSEHARLAVFCGLGAVLVLAAGFAYLAPGLLLRDDLGLIVAVPIAATWAITAAALAVRGLVLGGATGVVSCSFAVVTVTGATAGILTALCAHPIAAMIVPTGAFLLAVGALTAIVYWAREDRPLPASA